MTRVVDRSLLTLAKKNKKDEFYTQRSDIERELMHYENHFKGQTVYCNTDDPGRSNFVSYFVENFERLGLERLIATGLASGEREHGVLLDYDGSESARQKFESEEFAQLQGDGDFRSKECVDFLRQADIVVTNPPFSLLREFVAHLDFYSKRFLIIATVNAITYKGIFDLIQRGKVWLGVGLGRAISGFIVPESYNLYGSEAKINDAGERIVATNNALWLTNLDISKRHEYIPLVKSYLGNEEDYPLYDNLNGINVNKTKDIPNDWYGLMGVPITFLHKHNPEQFEIVRFRKGEDGKDLTINGKAPYFRIIIRRKQNRDDPRNLSASASKVDSLF